MLVDQRAGCVEEGVLVRHRIAVELVAGSKPQGIGAMILDAGCELEDAAPAGARDPAGGIKSGRLAEPGSVPEVDVPCIDGEKEAFEAAIGDPDRGDHGEVHVFVQRTRKKDTAQIPAKIYSKDGVPASCLLKPLG